MLWCMIGLGHGASNLFKNLGFIDNRIIEKIMNLH